MAVTVVWPTTSTTVVAAAAFAVTVTVGAGAVTVLGWKPAQAHALENFARSEQSHAHFGTCVLGSPRLPYLTVMVLAAAAPWVVMVVVVVVAVIEVDTSVEVVKEVLEIV